MPNGLNFDISNDEQFKYFVVQQFSVLREQTEGLPQIKIDVPLLKQEVADLKKDIKDDKFWGNVKAASGPIMVALHIAAKKMGINI
jgi:hypothetical protein